MFSLAGLARDWLVPVMVAERPVSTSDAYVPVPMSVEPMDSHRQHRGQQHRTSADSMMEMAMAWQWMEQTGADQGVARVSVESAGRQLLVTLEQLNVQPRLQPRAGIQTALELEDICENFENRLAASEHALRKHAHNISVLNEQYDLLDARSDNLSKTLSDTNDHMEGGGVTIK